eukprot:1888667-Alexandrium_andersonii.AAC.1
MGMDRRILIPYIAHSEMVQTRVLYEHGYGEPVKRTCAIAQGCPLSMTVLSAVLSVWVRFMKCEHAGVEVRSLADDLLVTTRGVGEQEGVEGSVEQHRAAVEGAIGFLTVLGAKVATEKCLTISSSAEARMRFKRDPVKTLGKPMPVGTHMRDLGSHMSLGRTRYGVTITQRLKEASKDARDLSTFPTGRRQRIAVLRGKVLPKALYGVEAAP